MKVPSKISILSTTLFLAMVASAVGYSGEARADNYLERKTEKLRKTREQLREMEESDQESSGRYARKYGKAKKTEMQIRQELARVDEANRLLRERQESDRIRFENERREDAERSVNVMNPPPASSPSVGSRGDEYETTTGGCAAGYYGPFNGSTCIAADKFKEGPCDDEKGGGQGFDPKNGGQGEDPKNGGQGKDPKNGGQGKEPKDGGQGKDPTCALPEILNPVTHKCEAPAKPECDLKTKQIDPVSGECVDLPPPVKPVEAPKPVRTKKVVARKPIARKPVVRHAPSAKKPVAKKELKKEDCPDQMENAKKLAELQKEKDRLAQEKRDAQSQLDEANRKRQASDDLALQKAKEAQEALDKFNALKNEPVVHFEVRGKNKNRYMRENAGGASSSKTKVKWTAEGDVRVNDLNSVKNFAQGMSEGRASAPRVAADSARAN